MLNDYSNNNAGHEGVRFTIAEGFCKHQCIVLRQALYLLSDDADPQDLVAIYKQHEYQIQQVARRLIGSGQGHKPLVIGPWSLRQHAA